MIWCTALHVLLWRLLPLASFSRFVGRKAAFVNRLCSCWQWIRLLVCMWKGFAGRMTEMSEEITGWKGVLRQVSALLTYGWVEFGSIVCSPRLCLLQIRGKSFALMSRETPSGLPCTAHWQEGWQPRLFLTYLGLMGNRLNKCIIMYVCMYVYDTVLAVIGQYPSLMVVGKYSLCSSSSMWSNGIIRSNALFPSFSSSSEFFGLMSYMLAHQNAPGS